MAKLRIGGETTEDKQRSRAWKEFGPTLFTLIDQARTTGKLDERIDRMLAWLQTNRHHPKFGEREARYWNVVSERNDAMFHMVETGDELGRLARAMNEEMLAQWTEVLGAEPTLEFVQQVAILARQYPTYGGFQAIDQWVRQYSGAKKTIDPANPEPCPF